MSRSEKPRSDGLFPLFASWAALVALTLLSLLLGQEWARAGWLHWSVAGIVWLKGWVVARYFIESHLAHPFIASVVRVFILCVPVALIVTAWIRGSF